MLNRADYNFVVKYGEVTPDGVAVFDLNSRKFVYVNRFLRHILGMGERETLDSGEAVLKFVHPDDMRYAEDRYRELLSIGCMPPVEIRVMQSGGDTRHISMEVLWLEECYTFALFVKDITALRKHEEFVVKVSAQKDTLLDMLLHSLSAPLYLSRDVLSLLKKESSAEAERMVNIITDSTAHCIEIIQQYLQEEHTESTGVMVRKSRFNLVEKIKIVVSLISQINPSKQISLLSSLEDSFILTDEVKAIQIIHNILSNAVKYTTDTGSIDIHIQESDKAVRVSVSDDGIGVPEKLRDRILNERVTGTQGLNGEPSNGMGLYLCSQLARMINGRISYFPGEGRGSRFVFDLPRE